MIIGVFFVVLAVIAQVFPELTLYVLMTLAIIIMAVVAIVYGDAMIVSSFC